MTIVSCRIGLGDTALSCKVAIPEMLNVIGEGGEAVPPQIKSRALGIILRYFYRIHVV